MTMAAVSSRKRVQDKLKIVTSGVPYLAYQSERSRGLRAVIPRLPWADPVDFHAGGQALDAAENRGEKGYYVRDKQSD